MKKNCTLILFLFPLFTFAQSIETAICPLKQDTDQWLKTFQAKTTMAEQLQLIKNKVYDDASFFEDISAMQTQENQKRDVEKTHSKECCCPLRIGLVYDNNDGVVLDLFKKPQVEKILELLTADNISRIELNRYQKNDVSSFATEACSGVTIFSENDDLKKDIKKLLRSVR